jgi:hypothetical protein
MPTTKQVLDAYSQSPQIQKTIDNYLAGNSYELSKVGFLVGGKLLVFRRVSGLTQGVTGYGYSFFHQIRKDKEWKKVPVYSLVGEKVFEQGI